MARPSPGRGGGRRRPAGREAARGTSRGSLRVVAGTAGGLRISTPDGTDTRPTSDRVREATFNALESLGVVDGARVLDAYAGSGALGIEALSRGAEHVTFVDTDGEARQVIEANLLVTNLADRATIQGGDALRLVASSASKSWDLILLDPPYVDDRWVQTLDAAAAALAADGVVVIESDREVLVPPTLGVIRSRRYGSTVVTFASPIGDPT